MNQRAMAISQVFIFIIAGITFALIMIFGYKAVSGFLESGEEVEFIQFKNNLESSVKNIYTEFGAVRIKYFFPPNKYEQVCFIDLDYDGFDKGVKISELCELDPIACTAWGEAKSYDSFDQNVFLTPSADIGIKVFRLKIEEGFFCQSIINGKFTLYLEGKGDRTLIKDYQSEDEQ